MTKEELKTATGQELINERNYCGVDGYYGNYLDNVNEEMLNRFNRLVELEKENAELKKQVEKHKWNDIFLEDCAVYDNKITEEYTTLQERIADLEKENKELKRDKQNLRADLRTARNNLQAKDTAYHLTMEELNCVITDFNTFKSEAKELLKKFIETSNPIYFEEDRQKVKAEAEQFLKE